MNYGKINNQAAILLTYPAQLKRTLTSGYFSAIFFTSAPLVTSNTSVTIPIVKQSENLNYHIEHLYQVVYKNH